MGIAIPMYVLIKNVSKPPEEKMLASFLKKMKKRGYSKRASQGLEEFVQTIEDERIRESALDFTQRFHKIYFRDRIFMRNDLQDLRKIVSLI